MEAKDALTAFRLTAVGSPDLTLHDGQILADKAKKRFELAFPPGGVADVAEIGVRRELADESLSDIGLYDR